MANEVEIGRGKRGRRAYTLDDIALVSARRTRDPADVNVGWQIDAYHVDVPIMAAPMDSVMSPDTAILFGKLGGIGVLDLDGLWTRYENPQPILDEIAQLPADGSIARLQQIYSAPIQEDLITERLEYIRKAGVVVAGKLSPQRTQRYWRAVVEAGVDLFVIRGTTVSAEHVSSRAEPLNLKRFGDRWRRLNRYCCPAPHAYWCRRYFGWLWWGSGACNAPVSWSPCSHGNGHRRCCCSAS